MRWLVTIVANGRGKVCAGACTGGRVTQTRDVPCRLDVEITLSPSTSPLPAPSPVLLSPVGVALSTSTASTLTVSMGAVSTAEVKPLEKLASDTTITPAAQAIMARRDTPGVTGGGDGGAHVRR